MGRFLGVDIKVHPFSQIPYLGIGLNTGSGLVFCLSALPHPVQPASDFNFGRVDLPWTENRGLRAGLQNTSLYFALRVSHTTAAQIFSQQI